MRTVTITLHDTDNCGSSLQAFALQHFLQEHNVENELIDYVPDYTKNNGSPIRTAIRKILFYKDSKVRKEKFQKFKIEYLKVTEKKYHTYSELKATPPKADVYITGSDQLWNSAYGCGRDPAYYLGFVKNGKKIAYAASLGREIVPDENLEIIKRYVNDFSGVTVREKSSVKQLERLLSCPINHVCDPVLLNPIEDYDEIKSKRIIQESYILIYLAQSTEMGKIERLSQILKEKTGAKIVLIGSYRNRCKSDIHLRDVAPGEFLSLIANAEYIISNSFHATMFSLMYEKQFMTVLPPENGARIREILKLAGLENLAVKDTVEPQWITKEEYAQVKGKLTEFRVASASKLLEMIGVSNDEQKR